MHVTHGNRQAWLDVTMTNTEVTTDERISAATARMQEAIRNHSAGRKGRGRPAGSVDEGYRAERVEAVEGMRAEYDSAMSAAVEAVEGIAEDAGLDDLDAVAEAVAEAVAQVTVSVEAIVQQAAASRGIEAGSFWIACKPELHAAGLAACTTAEGLRGVTAA